MALSSITIISSLFLLSFVVMSAMFVGKNDLLDRIAPSDFLIQYQENDKESEKYTKNFLEKNIGKEKIKNLYLQEFKKENDPAEKCFDVDIKNISEEVISIMRKKGLTYEEAYAVLQYSYNKLKFESNFIHLEELNLEV